MGKISLKKNLNKCCTVNKNLHILIPVETTTTNKQGETMKDNLKIIGMFVITFTFLFLVLSNAESNTEDQIKYYNIKTQLNQGVK